jgi:hypothetical protein
MAAISDYGISRYGTFRYGESTAEVELPISVLDPHLVIRASMSGVLTQGSSSSPQTDPSVTSIRTR